MDENQIKTAKERWEAVFDSLLAIVVKKSNPLGPQELARLLVEYVASPDFWTDDMKTDFTQMLLPSVQAWFEKKVATDFPA